jgi:uncharacterized protein YbgA (DUF1722 family)/uncharacterized protein YbbK (DUF523 family)
LPAERVRIGVSTCLLGELVRYDGQHKRDAIVCDALAHEVDFVAVCPEVEAGFGVPREPVRLIKRGAATHMVGVHSGDDVSERMNAWADARARELAATADLSGYILKKDSPSCGMTRVKRFSAMQGASPARDGVGLFAAALARHLPNLPVEEEGRLHDTVLRDTFLESVFAYRRWRDLRALLERGGGVGALVAFHTAHKLSLLAHVPAAYQALGRIVAGSQAQPRGELLASYEATFMAALRKPATRGRHTNVLQHMAGYFKKTLDDPARRELEQIISDYSAGVAPLAAPLTLLRHHVKRLDVAYLAGQRYLDPPAEVRAVETGLAQAGIDLR